MTDFTPGVAASARLVPGGCGPCSGRGFSLIEMMIALVVAGILLFVALPTYQFAVIKSGRAAARAVLLDVVARQEQYFSNNKRYSADLPSLGLPQPYYIDAQADSVEESRAAYRIELALIDAAFDGVRAVPVNRQTADSACLIFELSRLGVRSVSGSLAVSPGACW